MKNVIFDLGGVLIKGEPISILNNCDIDKKTYLELKRFFDGIQDLDYGEGSLKDLFISCNYPDNIKQKYEEKLIQYFKYRTINIDLIDLINKLKKNGYNVFVLSDNNWEFFNYFKNDIRFNMIDGWTVSCEHGFRKKDGKLFEIFINEYNIKPSECYFIDNSQINIDTALKYDIKVYLFNENKDIRFLYDDMKEHGINV
jgi:putative hydrolase of the HAD superfamily